jgi:hypothetical protein
MSVVRRVVSGGQTGADRAALDEARAAGVAHGGWCPAGGLAEDMTEPPGLLARYPGLRETESSDPTERTVLNVRDSDATLAVVPSGPPTGGTLLAVQEAARLVRPCLVTDGEDPEAVLTWLAAIGEGITLNVAGPRESSQPGTYARTRELLAAVLTA